MNVIRDETQTYIQAIYQSFVHSFPSNQWFINPTIMRSFVMLFFRKRCVDLKEVRLIKEGLRMNLLLLGLLG